MVIFPNSPTWKLESSRDDYWSKLTCEDIVPAVPVKPSVCLWTILGTNENIKTKSIVKIKVYNIHVLFAPETIMLILLLLHKMCINCDEMDIAPKQLKLR